MLPVTNRSCRMGWIDADEGAYGRVRLCVWFPFGSAGMKDTVLPDVTTSLFVCGESSIDVMGPGNVMLVVRVRVRRSHHLQLDTRIDQ